MVTRRSYPNLEAARLLMTDLTAKVAFHDVGFRALASLMADLVALETELGITIEAVVSVLATKDAVGSAALIRAFPSHVAELLAIAALYSRI